MRPRPPSRPGDRRTNDEMKTSTLLIRTPEGIVFSQLLAGPVTRSLAWFIDLLCLSALMMILSQFLILLQLVSPSLAGALYALGYFVISIGYGIADIVLTV